ncbi:hypothetical protein FFLO_06900 [Filobasidium floriforme]|uniref:Uncharacterized protein n=1 Tax=Filobasidium floriforme TaxID=5210 RepID=A0A8K0JEH9_9TREE|nr:uncharacterized protein HD553DRAFT_334757 [Filobasidium floriforme]KAG7527474.1 hypothetical protein FFLO_06900 [Filobasidium floriforme]KAH8087103.1 hypothetical protein HD553DRAFT_334757 [Filobasidium floriforme]
MTNHPTSLGVGDVRSVFPRFSLQAILLSGGRGRTFLKRLFGEGLRFRRSQDLSKISANVRNHVRTAGSSRENRQKLKGIRSQKRNKGIKFHYGLYPTDRENDRHRGGENVGIFCPASCQLVRKEGMAVGILCPVPHSSRVPRITGFSRLLGRGEEARRRGKLIRYDESIQTIHSHLESHTSFSIDTLTPRHTCSYSQAMSYSSQSISNREPTRDSSIESGYILDRVENGITQRAHQAIQQTYRGLGAEATGQPAYATNAYAVLEVFSFEQRRLGDNRISLPDANRYKMANAISLVVPPQCPDATDPPQTQNHAAAAPIPGLVATGQNLAKKVKRLAPSVTLLPTSQPSPCIPFMARQTANAPFHTNSCLRQGIQAHLKLTDLVIVTFHSRFIECFTMSVWGDDDTSYLSDDGSSRDDRPPNFRGDIYKEIEYIYDNTDEERHHQHALNEYLQGAMNQCGIQLPERKAGRMKFAVTQVLNDYSWELWRTLLWDRLVSISRSNPLHGKLSSVLRTDHEAPSRILVIEQTLLAHLRCCKTQTGHS